MAIGDNLAIVLDAWVTMLREGHTVALAVILDERATWDGLPEGGVCRNRDEILEVLDRLQPAPPRVNRIEGIEIGSHVVMLADSPDLPDEVCLVFTFHAGRVISLHSTANRAEALQIAETAS